MRPSSRFLLLAPVLILASITSLRSAPAPVTAAPWDKVEKALGHPGTLLPGDVFKVGIPRTDLEVTLDGVRIEPPLALGSWAAFRKMGNGDAAMVMGDLVLLEKETGPVMKSLLEQGFQVTALHNHLIGEKPRLMYLHYEGSGEPGSLAEILRKALALTATPFPGATARAPSAATLDPAEKAELDAVQKTLGRDGKMAGRVLQVAFPRPETIRCEGMEIPPAMGMATALNFQPAPGGIATTGDFVLIDDEVIPVLQALRQGGLEVTAIHSHMLHESPTLKFVHFWAVEPAAKIAQALRGALDKVAPGK